MQDTHTTPDYLMLSWGAGASIINEPAIGVIKNHIKNNKKLTIGAFLCYY